MLRKICLATAAVVLSSCATMGSQFQFQGPDSIVKGVTTKAEILAKFGEPFRVGFDSGNVKWTYGYYHYSLFGDSQTKDLDIVFDNSNVVASYAYSSSMPEEVKTAVGSH